MDITPIILTLIFVSGFIVVAYDQFALSKGWTIEPWMRGNSFLKLSGVFSIFMAPALAIHMLPWWFSIFVVIAGLACFFIFIFILEKRVQLAAAAGLAIGWLWLGSLLVEM